MASGQQALPVPAPVPPNPNPTAPADPTPPAGARKLPIKRRSPRPSSSPPSSSSPASSDPLRAPAAGGGGAGSDQQQPPFKFQRIWSESDELRFLQGLLGCGAQGLVFPRDLNVFYDRFSESMPQPYTRAQLSEKLRRLKNKYRSVSARVAGGLDPARLAPHDRDVLHLCSRLWDPANAATSPFTSGGGASGNKRRRANPRGTQLLAPDASGDSNSHDYNGEQPEDVVALPNGNNGIGNEIGDHKVVVPCSNEHRMANAVLDVFEECLREAKASGIINNGNVGGSAEESELAKRWRVQRMDELHVLSRRLRLLVEDAAAAGH
ncbi:hypothetical protein PAHAL_9G119300 [Panicum hallii]|uniref:Glabrous enhancer-binding protein-like DBD domain-containing protein n=1 Tax=Panicum hallii TaxID=206008 RepID=A0A2S3IIY7_9POAL|nr:hypothetical protein PAHAL_9G119300 [Panicum hallii]